jgi:hypothetical protein
MRLLCNIWHTACKESNIALITAKIVYFVGYSATVIIIIIIIISYSRWSKYSLKTIGYRTCQWTVSISSVNLRRRVKIK